MSGRSARLSHPRQALLAPDGVVVDGRVHAQQTRPHGSAHLGDVGNALPHDPPALEHWFLLPDSEPECLANDRSGRSGWHSSTLRHTLWHQN